MSRNTFAKHFLFISLLASAACASQITQEDIVQPNPALGHNSFLLEHEQMRFRVSVAGISGGVAEFRIGAAETIEGRRVLPVRSLMETRGAARLVKVVRDQVSAQIYPETGKLHRLEADFLFGEKRSYVRITRNDKEQLRIEQRRHEQKRWFPRNQRLPDNARTYDSHGVLGILRAWRPKNDARSYIFQVAGKRLWKTNLHYRGKESIEHRGAPLNAHRIDGTSRRLNIAGTPQKNKPARRWTMWISDDESRLPVLVLAQTRFGAVRIELTDYVRPPREAAIQD